MSMKSFEEQMRAALENYRRIGRQDYHRGVGVEQNPFRINAGPNGSLKAAGWEMGWIEARGESQEEQHGNG